MKCSLVVNIKTHIKKAGEIPAFVSKTKYTKTLDKYCIMCYYIIIETII